MATLFTGPWNYHERRDGQLGAISKWMQRAHLSPKTRARFDRALDQLRALPKTSWSKPNPASNIGDHIYVIRFSDVTNQQLRVFGHFHDGHGCFVMTFDGTEKDNVYYPANYQAVGKRHKATCDSDFQGATLEFEDRCPVCGHEENGAA